MKKIRKQLVGLTILTIMAGLSLTGDAGAGIRRRVPIKSSGKVIRTLRVSPAYQSGLTVVRYPVYRRRIPVSARSRAIAIRLARYTGVSLREIYRLRRCGYSWYRIGRYLRLPRSVVRTAMHRRSWRRLLRGQLLHNHRGAAIRVRHCAVIR